MPIPTYTDALGQDSLGPTVSIIKGSNIFNLTPDDKYDEEGLSIKKINEELAQSSTESIEFLPETPLEDLPFDQYKKTLS